MPEPYALTVREWGKTHFNVSQATAYRIVNCEDPPPLMHLNGRMRVAVGSEEYREWLKRRTSGGRR